MHQWLQYSAVDGWRGQGAKAWELLYGQSSSGCLMLFAAYSSPKRGSHLLPMLLIFVLALLVYSVGYPAYMLSLVLILFFVLYLALCPLSCKFCYLGCCLYVFTHFLLVTTQVFVYSLVDTLFPYLSEILTHCVWLCHDSVKYMYMLLDMLF